MTPPAAPAPPGSASPEPARSASAMRSGGVGGGPDGEPEGFGAGPSRADRDGRGRMGRGPVSRPAGQRRAHQPARPDPDRHLRAGPLRPDRGLVARGRMDDRAPAARDGRLAGLSALPGRGRRTRQHPASAGSPGTPAGSASCRCAHGDGHVFDVGFRASTQHFPDGRDLIQVVATDARDLRRVERDRLAILNTANSRIGTSLDMGRTAAGAGRGRGAPVRRPDPGPAARHDRGPGLPGRAPLPGPADPAAPRGHPLGRAQPALVAGPTRPTVVRPGTPLHDILLMSAARLVPAGPNADHRIVAPLSARGVLLGVAIFSRSAAAPGVHRGGPGSGRGTGRAHRDLHRERTALPAGAVHRADARSAPAARADTRGGRSRRGVPLPARPGRRRGRRGLVRRDRAVRPTGSRW